MGSGEGLLEREGLLRRTMALFAFFVIFKVHVFLTSVFIYLSRLGIALVHSDHELDSKLCGRPWYARGRKGNSDASFIPRSEGHSSIILVWHDSADDRQSLSRPSLQVASWD
jgi:hypothetical protein